MTHQEELAKLQEANMVTYRRTMVERENDARWVDWVEWAKQYVAAAQEQQELKDNERED